MKQFFITAVLLLAQTAASFTGSSAATSHASDTIESADGLTILYRNQPIKTIARGSFSVSVAGPPMIDREKYDRLIETLDRLVCQAPVNASFGQHGQIVPGKSGHRLNRRIFKEQFEAFFFREGPGTLEVPLLFVYPEVDSELLADLHQQPIGRYVTHFNPGNKNRAHNISLSAKAIDSHVVFPNKIFSFNEVVGKRTPEKGYKRAPIIVKGEYAEDIGGGICQVSSTLFNAVDRAGLHIVRRYSHSKRVPYVPPGRDATVSWYGPDFCFQNKYRQPILIRARQSGGSLIVTLYSSEGIRDQPRKVP